MAELPDFLTVGEAAAVLRIGRTLAYQLAQEWIATGGARGIPCRRIGRLLRVPRAELAEFMGGPITWPPAAPATPVVVEPDGRRDPSAPRSSRAATPRPRRSSRRAPAEQTSLPFTD